MEAPKVIQVIRSYVPRGKGEPNSPHRNVMQFHTLEGRFLAEEDPITIQKGLTDSERKRIGDVYP